MKLSEHFSLEELTHSEIATRRGLDNTPPADVQEHLTELARSLELVRALLGKPMLVSSGYRAPAVNEAVGGSSHSAHCLGYAADFICPGFGTPQAVAKAIRDSGIPFDQVIYEGTWVHFSIDPRQRRQTLTAHFGGGRATYTEGIA